MEKFNKLISLSMISVILSSNLYSLTFEVNTQNEYLKTFEKTFLSPDDHRIIVNCNNCGISKKDVKYYNILDNVNKDSNITFVLNNVSVTYNKEVFLNNMEHLFIKNDSINKVEIEQERNIQKFESNNEEYVLIDGEKVPLDVIKGLLNKKQNKPIPDKNYEPVSKGKKQFQEDSLNEKVIVEKKLEPMKIEENVIQDLGNKKDVKNIKKGKVIELIKDLPKIEEVKEIIEQPKMETKENTIKNLFENTKVEKNINSDGYNVYVIASYNNELQANNFIKSKLNKYKTNVVKNGKIYTLEILLNNGTKEEQLSFVRSFAKDAYLKKENIKKDISGQPKLEENKKNEVKNINNNISKNVVGVYSSKSKVEVENYVKRVFYNRNNNVKKTNNGYYLGYIEINNSSELNDIKKLSKDAWLIKNFKN